MFGHIQRMRDDRKLKSIMTGIMVGVVRRGRPCRKWLQDIEEWCGMNIQEITQSKRKRNLEEHSQVCSGHIRTGSPWTMKKKKMKKNLQWFFNNFSSVIIKSF